QPRPSEPLVHLEGDTQGGHRTRNGAPIVETNRCTNSPYGVACHVASSQRMAAELVSTARPTGEPGGTIGSYPGNLHTSALKGSLSCGCLFLGPPWLGRLYVAAFHDSAYTPDMPLPLRLGPRIEAEGHACPLPHLQVMIAAAREVREWAAGL